MSPRFKMCAKSPALLLLAAAALVFGPGSAVARTQTADEREAQRTELYREAMKAAGAGRWAEAKERLRGVVAIRSSPKVLFSLGQTEEQLGQLASAQADYARALEGAALEGKGEVVQAAEGAQRALSPRVPHLRILVSGGEQGRANGGAAATLDDHPLTLGAYVAVDPGEHRLAVSAPEARSVTATVKLVEGQQLDFPIALEQERLAPPAPAVASTPAPVASEQSESNASAADPSPNGSSGSPLRVVGLVTAGVGVVALGAGAVFGLESIAKHNDAEKACPATTCPAASGAYLWHDAVTFGNVSTIALIAGGAFLVGGTVLWLAAPKSHAAAAQVGLGLGSVELRGVW